MSLNTVLAFDTSTEALSVALKHGDEVLNHFELAPRLHAQKILPTINNMLAQKHLKVQNVNAFVFGRGPGAFTGVRTAIGVVQGLALAFDKPCYGVSTLLAIAEGARRETGQEHVLAVMDARMGEVYASAYRFLNGVWSNTLPEQVCAPEQLKYQSAITVFGSGSGWSAYANQLTTAVDGPLLLEADTRFPQAMDMLSIALPALNAGEGVPAEMAMPVYLRDKVAEKAK